MCVMHRRWGHTHTHTHTPISCKVHAQSQSHTRASPSAGHPAPAAAASNHSVLATQRSISHIFSVGPGRLGVGGRGRCDVMQRVCIPITRTQTPNTLTNSHQHTTSPNALDSPANNKQCDQRGCELPGGTAPRASSCRCNRRPPHFAITCFVWFRGCGNCPKEFGVYVHEFFLGVVCLCVGVGVCLCVVFLSLLSGIRGVGVLRERSAINARSRTRTHMHSSRVLFASSFVE